MYYVVIVFYWETIYIYTHFLNCFFCLFLTELDQAKWHTDRTLLDWNEWRVEWNKKRTWSKLFWRKLKIKVFVSTDIHFETVFNDLHELSYRAKSVQIYVSVVNTVQIKTKRITGLEQRIKYFYSQLWGLTLEGYATA